MEIKITALTEEGTKALEQHIAETAKLSFKNRLIFKTAGYKQEVLSIDPYIVSLIINNRQANNPNFICLIEDQIVNALKENGATKDTDYKLEWC